MKLTHSQKITVLALGLVIAIAGGFVGGVIVRNASQIAQLLTPTATLSSPTPYRSPTPPPPPTPTAPPYLEEKGSEAAPPRDEKGSEAAPSPTPEAPPTDFDQAVVDEPENPYPRIERGYIYLDQTVYELARDDFDAALAIDDTLPRAYLGRAQVRFHLKEWSTALDDLEQAIALNPDLAEAHAWQGYILYHYGEYTPAIDALRQAIEIDAAHGEDDPRKHLYLGHSLRENGNPASAVAAYDAALALAPNSVSAHVGRARAQSDLGDLEAMQINLSHAMSAGPFDPAALNGRAWLYAQHTPQHLFEARQLAQQAVDRAPTDLDRARYLYTLAWITYQQNYDEQAIAILEEAATLATIEEEVIYDQIPILLEEIRSTQ